MNLIIIGGYTFWFLIILTGTIGVFLMFGKVLLWLFAKYQDLRSGVKLVTQFLLRREAQSHIMTDEEYEKIKSKRNASGWVPKYPNLPKGD